MFKLNKLLRSPCSLLTCLVAVVLSSPPSAEAKPRTTQQRSLAEPVVAQVIAQPVGQSSVNPAERPVAHAPGDLVVILERGESLLDLVKREVAPPHDVRSVAQLNAIINPLHIEPGRKILIPAAWRKPKIYAATVVSVEGVAQGLSGTAIRAGSALSESDLVQTGAQSVVILRFSDGTVVRIPPASQVRIERLRGYHGSDAISARMNLEKGGIEVQSESNRVGQSAPAIGRQFQIQTPRATASVRGTYFRVANGELQSAAEVLDGSVQWAGTSENRPLSGGFGVLADNQGKLGPNEKLLAKSAQLISESRSLEVDTEIEFAPVFGAKNYLVETARDAQFASLIHSVVQSDAKVLVRSEADGPLYLKVRAISESGLSGYDAQFTLQFAARPVYPKVSSSEPAGVIFQNSARLNWSAVEQAKQYRIQIANDAGFAQLVADELLPAANYSFSLKAPVADITPYFWRVASVDTKNQGPWGGARQLEFGPLLSAATSEVGESSVSFEWMGKPNQQFEAQLSNDAQFQRLTKSETVKGGAWQISSLEPGQYQMRMRQLFSNGVTGPYSPPVKFEILSYLRDGSGQSIKSGTGKAVEITR